MLISQLKAAISYAEEVNETRLKDPPSQPPQDCFAAIRNDRMDLYDYDFNTQKTSQHQLPTSVWSGYVHVDRTTVLIVGEQVETLDLLTLQVTPLAPLLTPRNCAGVAQVGNTVFAFGGFVSGTQGDPMTVCEKCSLLPTHWTPLPPMQYARSLFTPCLFKDSLYLVSSVVKAVESFSPLTDTFTVLPVCLPAQLQPSASVTFVARGELVVLTNSKQVARWKVESEGFFRVSATDRECASFHVPRIVGTVAYIANNADRAGPKVE